jgi:hypothetical protein
LKSVSLNLLELSGPVQACNGIALPLTITVLHLEHSLCGEETWTVGKGDQKYLESFVMWCWRGMEKVSWTDRERDGEYYVQSRRQVYPTDSEKKEG